MDVTVKEVVRDLIDVIENEGGVLHGNRKALALLDAESADKYITDLEEQIAETEGALAYNAEDWIDAEVDRCMNEFEASLNKYPDITGQAKRELITIMEEFGKVLTAQLAKKAMGALNLVDRVYT